MKRVEDVRGCFLHFVDIDQSASFLSGVDLKVRDQIATLNDAGLDCRFVYYRQPQTLFGKIRSCLPFCSDGVAWPDPYELAAMDYLYIRKPRFVSKEFISFFMKLKTVNPKLKILYEIPTYPYDAELSGLLLLPARLKDKRWRTYLSRYVDRLFYISDRACGQVFGCPSTRIKNGIRVSRIAKKKPVANLDSVNVICCAAFMWWHGIDRFIEGMARYYEQGGTREVLLHLVGEGEENEKLTTQVERLDLGDKVRFYGKQSTDKIAEVIDQCSFGIDLLGMHRKGATVSSSLKSREYLAYGMPFMSSAVVDVCDGENVDFIWNPPADESPVSIEDFLDYHDEIYARYDQQGLIDLIRGFAEDHVDMSKTLDPVVSYIRKELVGNVNES